jgi:hypothetical protein
MFTHRFGGCVALLALLLAPDGRAQISSSSSYSLGDFVFDSAGGGTASVGFSAHVSIGAVTGGTSTSPNFRSGLGILETNKPMPALAPVFFAATPDFGPRAGGTPVTISGLNFDKLGVGPSLTVNVGGGLATGVTVLSSTQLTARVPAGTGVNGGAGPRPVTVTTSLGSSTNAEGYVYTPAVRVTPITRQKAQVVFRNYGPPGQPFVQFYSYLPTFGNTKFGKILIGPAPIYQLFPLLFYPSPDGISSITLTVPDDPILDYVTIYWQSLDITQFGPVKGKLTNGQSTLIDPD